MVGQVETPIYLSAPQSSSAVCPAVNKLYQSMERKNFPKAFQLVFDQFRMGIEWGSFLYESLILSDLVGFDGPRPFERHRLRNSVLLKSLGYVHFFIS